MRIAAIRGRLAQHDNKSHLWHEVDIPPGASALHLGFTFAPARIEPYANLLTLTVFDPCGAWRGEQHSCLPSVEIILTADWASPGYIPGPIRAGRWRLSISAHGVLNTAKSPLRYRLIVDCETVQPVAMPDLANDSAPCPPGRNWYRGDLHTHTLHSDGICTVADLARLAWRRGLDFVAVTDHNTVSGLAEARGLCGDAAMVIPGMEMTTFHGHFLALGVSDWIDWRVGLNGYSIEQAVTAIRAAGGLFTINHPLCQGDPGCTGCRWEYDLPPQQADGLEVWNCMWEQPGNSEALALWHRLLNEGQRVVATAGSDFHDPRQWLAGAPCVDVCATSLSTGAILQAIKGGHLSLTAGPRLTLEATAGDATWIIGDEVTAAGALTLRLTWQGVAAGTTARLVGGGAPVESWPAGSNGSAVYVAAQPGRWYTAELHAGTTLLATTNAIHVQH